jgi:hypothetical protein
MSDADSGITPWAVPAGAARQYVVIDLHETLAGQMPVPSPDDEGELVHTRVVEDEQVGLSFQHLAAGHRRMGPGSLGCGSAHALCIARVTAGRSGPKVTPEARLRPRAGK